MSLTGKKRGSKRKKLDRRSGGFEWKNSTASCSIEGPRSPRFIVGDGELNSSEEAQEIHISSINTKEKE